MKESGVGLDGTGRQIIDFDHYRGYGQWHRFCREHFSREAPIEDATTFAEEGFERIRFLGARDAARLLAHLKLREGVETHVHEIDTYIQCGLPGDGGGAGGELSHGRSERWRR